MEKLLFISRDSIFSGSILSKTAEIIDSLATVLTNQYEVYLLTLDTDMVSLARKTASTIILDKNKKKIKFAKVNYYLIKSDAWEEEVAQLINTIQPNIIHNFAESHFIDTVNYPLDRSIYTFHYYEDIENINDLAKYDFVTTSSSVYAEAIQDKFDDLIALPTGLLTNAFAPQKGFLLAKSYDMNHLNYKAFCKRTFLNSHGIFTQNPPIFLIAGLCPEQNLENIIEAIPTIQENNGLLVIATRSNIFYHDALSKYNKKNGVIYFAKYPSMVQIPGLLSATDFYLHPKSHNTGNLLPFLASNYGAIPMLALDKHNTEDYFNDNNAIIVNNNLNDKILEAFELYQDQDKMRELIKSTMKSVPAWNDQKEAYLKLYSK